MLKRDYIYRFKTKEEFVNEFGNDWRGVPGYFSIGMDSLLGQTIKDRKLEYGQYAGSQFYDIIDSHINMNIQFRYYSFNAKRGYNISKEMILKVIVKPNYKSKKLIK